MSDATEPFGIAEVAARTGLAPDTLRYFERQGVVPTPRRDGAGRRRYTPADVELIRMLVHLRETGMPLADIAQVTGAMVAEALYGVGCPVVLARAEDWPQIVQAERLSVVAGEREARIESVQP